MVTLAIHELFKEENINHSMATLPNYELFGEESLEEVMQQINSRIPGERKTIVRSSPDRSPSRDEVVNKTETIVSRFDSIIPQTLIVKAPQKTKKQKTVSDIPKHKNTLYKTEMCKLWQEGKVCKYGKGCHFAHGVLDMKCRDRHTKFKTTQCNSFHSIGFCRYGDRCSFIHDEPIYLNAEKGRLSKMI